MNRPNILWIMTDEQRRDSLGCYGNGRGWAKSPNLDSLAASGIRFDAAVTPSPMCIPARTSLLSGLYPHQSGVWQNAENPLCKQPPRGLISEFARAGYQTASFGKQHYVLEHDAFEHEEQIVLSDLVDYTHYKYGLSEEDNDAVKYPGPTEWIVSGKFPGDLEDTPEYKVVSRASEWLHRRDRGVPFFLRVSFNGPHTPAVTPEPFYSMYPPEAIQFPAEAEPRISAPPEWLSSLTDLYAGSNRLSPAQIARMRATYYGCASFVDSQIGRLLKAIRGQGDVTNTIVFFTSDHGTHLGDFGLIQKQTFFEPVVTVPTILSWPEGLPKGVAVSTPVDTLSFLPIISELAGIGGSATMAGDLQSGREPPARPVFSEFTLNPAVIRTHERLVMVRSGTFKFSFNADKANDTSILVDLANDPYERVNLAADSAYRNVKNDLQEAVNAHLHDDREGNGK